MNITKIKILALYYEIISKTITNVYIYLRIILFVLAFLCSWPRISVIVIIIIIYLRGANTYFMFKGG